MGDMVSLFPDEAHLPLKYTQGMQTCDFHRSASGVPVEWFSGDGFNLLTELGTLGR